MKLLLKLITGENIIADFEGKTGKREIAQGVLGSNSLIITLDDLKKIIIDIKKFQKIMLEFLNLN